MIPKDFCHLKGWELSSSIVRELLRIQPTIEELPNSPQVRNKGIYRSPVGLSIIYWISRQRLSREPIVCLSEIHHHHSHLFHPFGLWDSKGSEESKEQSKGVDEMVDWFLHRTVSLLTFQQSSESNGAIGGGKGNFFDSLDSGQQQRFVRRVQPLIVDDFWELQRLTQGTIWTKDPTNAGSFWGLVFR